MPRPGPGASLSWRKVCVGAVSAPHLMHAGSVSATDQRSAHVQEPGGGPGIPFRKDEPEGRPRLRRGAHLDGAPMGPGNVKGRTVF